MLSGDSIPAVALGRRLAGRDSGNRFLLWAIYAPPSFHYGGVSQLLASFGDPRQWRDLFPYLGMWIFFVGLAWVGAIWSLRERRDRTSRTLLAVASLSAGGVLVVQFATNPVLPFPRYAYPVISGRTGVERDRVRAQPDVLARNRGSGAPAALDYRSVAGNICHDPVLAGPGDG